MGKNKTSIIWKISADELKQLVEKNNTMSGVLNHFGLKNKGHNNRTLKKRLDDEKIDYSKFKNNFGKGLIKPLVPLEDVLVESSSFNRGHLKVRLIKSGLLEEKCYECGLGSIWNGKKLILCLDHINGISDDNRIENLRLVCPNCHSQTKTFAGRNNRKTKNLCKKCNCEIHKTSKLCNDCEKLSRRKVDRPSKELLKEEIENFSWLHIARKYGVSDNTIRKWARSYKLI